MRPETPEDATNALQNLVTQLSGPDNRNERSAVIAALNTVLGGATNVAEAVAELTTEQTSSRQKYLEGRKGATTETRSGGAGGGRY